VVHVLYGSSGGTSSVDDLWFQGDSGVNGRAEAGDRFGDTLAIGDFDNDGCDDLVIGAPFEDWRVTTEDWRVAPDAGNAYAIYGGERGLDSSGDWIVIQGILQGSVAANELFATRLWVEDRNHDEFDDLIVMTPGECGPGRKGFNYIYGGDSGLGTLNNTWMCRELND
jgi:hypothetical protein